MFLIAISIFWTIAAVFSFIYGIASGRTDEIGTAAMQGAAAAVELCITTGGMICLWSGVMELMDRAGITKMVKRLLQPLLGRLFPRSSSDSDTFGALCSNVSANLLGLGNAATPAGIRAAEGMRRLGADNELTRLVVMNTASVQLIPTTVAAVRSALGSAAPYDILPCVWISSLCSVTTGLLVSYVLQRRTE